MTRKVTTRARKRSTSRATGRTPKTETGVFKDVRPAILERYEADGAAVVDATDGDESALRDAAEKLGMSYGKARRMYYFAYLKPSEKLFLSGKTDMEIGKELIHLRDDLHLAWDPDIWSRMLTTQAVARGLYEAAGGRDWDQGRNMADRPDGRRKGARAARGKAPTSKRNGKKVGGRTRAKRANH